MQLRNRPLKAEFDEPQSIKTKGWLWPSAFIIAFGGFLFCFIANFPGGASHDTFSLWEMAITGKYRDWHHPIIAFLMRIGLIFRNDFSPLLFLQLLLFWGGTYFFALALRKKIGNWALMAIFLGFLPFNIGLSGYLHKTPLLSACFLFVSSFLYFSLKWNIPHRWITGIVLFPFLFIGTVVRTYSYIAAIPILLLFSGYLFELRSDTNRRNKILALIIAPLILFSIIFISDKTFVYNILDAQMTPKIGVLYLYDLSAIYALTGNMYGKQFFYRHYDDHSKAKAFYKKHRGLYKIMFMCRLPQGEIELNQLQKEWISSIINNFPAYLRHRVNAISHCLGLSGKVPGQFRGHHSYNNKRNIYQIEKSKNSFYWILRKYQVLVKNMFFMQPWFWAGINLVFALCCILVSRDRKKADNIWPICAMIWSGTLLLGAYLLVCFWPDARFTYWVTLSTSYGAFGLAANYLVPRQRHFGWL